MKNDLVVVVPGVMGSSLARADGTVVWSTSPGGLIGALTTLGRHIRELELPPDQGDSAAPDSVMATGLMPSLHAIPGVWTPIQGYSELEKFLRLPRFGLGASNLVLFAYDWRLSNRYTAGLLKARVESSLERWRETAPDAKVIFICHSMGGLVARWYLDKLGGASIARALVTLGTPHRGALNAVEQLVNGVRKGAGPLKLDLTRFARSLPSTYQLLPEYACIQDDRGKLLKTTETSLPGLDVDRVADAMAFYDDLNAVAAISYPVVPIVGIRQPTWCTAYVAGDGVVPVGTIEGRDVAGDGTVPSLSARPQRMAETDMSLRGVGDGHGALAGNRSVLDQLDLLLTAEDIRYRDVGPELEIGVSVPDLHAVGEEVVVSVETAEPRGLEAVAVDERGVEGEPELVRNGSAGLGRLGPGGYTVVVRVPDDPVVPPVGRTTLVW